MANVVFVHIVPDGHFAFPLYDPADAAVEQRVVMFAIEALERSPFAGGCSIKAVVAMNGFAVVGLFPEAL